MPFTPTDKVLSEMIATAFKTGDIPERADQAGFSLRRLIPILSKKSDQIWKTGADELAILQKLELEHENKTIEKVRQSLIASRTGLSLAKIFFRQLLPLTVVVLLIRFIVMAYNNGWGVTFTNSFTLRNVIGLILTAVVLLVGFLVYRSLSENYSYRAYLQEDKVQEEPELIESKKKIDEARSTWDNKVINQGIKPLLKEVIDSQLNILFSPTLPVLEYSGLSEVFNSDNEMPTDAFHKLEFMMASMPGGSIGIAGPRGAGKTTLLKSICKDSLGKDDQPKVISILTSSPVEYQARDFILHLFSSVCFKALEITRGRKAVHSAWEEVEEIRQPMTAPFFQFLPALTGTCLITGFILVILSLVIAGLTMKTKPPAASPQPATSGANPPSGTPNDQASAKTQSEPVPSSALGRFLAALDLKAGSLLMWGASLIIISFAVAFSYSRMRRRDWEFRSFLMRKRSRFDFKPAVELSDPKHLEEIDDEARKWLKEIKFQQSYTSGWSGALKLPIGLEGGMSTAVSLAQQQLSLPDITKGFCDFLNLLARDFRVIIGIDELDKLESDQAAQRFLNEIKSIFGLEGIFYLISVSESAMSSFERRGLPFRDVFDSSFDSIIYVDYLDLNSAKRLIARRVIAMPPPFSHLCFCVSGGLARDLVRACRNLMELSNVSDSNGGQPDVRPNLSSLSSSLIKADLKSKVHAMVVAVKKAEQPSEAARLLDKLHKVESDLDSVPSLLQNYTDLLASPKSPEQPDKPVLTQLRVSDLIELYEGLKKSVSSKKRETGPGDVGVELAPLYEEFATYIYYSSTLLEFFGDKLDAATLEKVEKVKSFDQLARARQALAVNPKVTRSMVDEFRKSLSLPVPLLNGAQN